MLITVAHITVLYCIGPSIVLFSYSAFGCKSVLLNQFSISSVRFMSLNGLRSLKRRSSEFSGCDMVLITAATAVRRLSYLYVGVQTINV